MVRVCKTEGYQSLAEAQRKADDYRFDGCSNVEISNGPPYTVTGNCEDEAERNTNRKCTTESIPTIEEAKRKVADYEFDGCVDVEISDGPPYTVTGYCEN